MADVAASFGETAPLLGQGRLLEEDDQELDPREELHSDLPAVTLRNDSGISRLLYLSHFLSTWNSRLFEFGAVLFIAAIIPGTLLPASVYALIRSLSAIFFSAAVGKFVDSSDRLTSVRISIGLFRSQYVSRTSWQQWNVHSRAESGHHCLLRNITLAPCDEELYLESLKPSLGFIGCICGHWKALLHHEHRVCRKGLGMFMYS